MSDVSLLQYKRNSEKPESKNQFRASILVLALRHTVNQFYHCFMYRSKRTLLSTARCPRQNGSLYRALDNPSTKALCCPCHSSSVSFLFIRLLVTTQSTRQRRGGTSLHRSRAWVCRCPLATEARL